MNRSAAWLLALLGGCAATGAQAAGGCDAPEAAIAAELSVAAAATEAVSPDAVVPPPALAALARAALVRSAEVQGARSGRDAARLELAQAEAQKRPVLTLGGQLGVAQYRIDDVQLRESRANSVGLNLSAPLHDGGRQEQIGRYREELLASGEQGVVAARERVVRDVVATWLERGRYQWQERLYQRHVEKMSCLVGALEQVVALDRGRGSELLQARKGLQQAELSRSEARSARLQAELRLERLTGTAPPALEAGTTPPAVLLGGVPGLPDVQAQIAQHPDVQQLQRQADAMQRYAGAVQAETRPQWRWQLGTSSQRALHQTTSNWNAGISLNMTLADGGAGNAASDAAVARAEAAQRQIDAVVAERERQNSVLHEAADNAFGRARRVVGVLQDSEQVRRATYEQWSKLGRRSLFDLMSAETEHYQLGISYINAVHDGEAAVLQLLGNGRGVLAWLLPEAAAVAGR